MTCFPPELFSSTCCFFFLSLFSLLLVLVLGPLALFVAFDPCLLPAGDRLSLIFRRSFPQKFLFSKVWCDRYEIRGVLGKGSFGQVCEALDRESNTKVAIKIIKNKSAFRAQAKIEIELLEAIKQADKDDQHHMGETGIMGVVSLFLHPFLLLLPFSRLSLSPLAIPSVLCLSCATL